MRLFIVLFLSFSYLYAAIDINKASIEDFQDLNGIGKAKATKIVNYRELNGCFDTVEQLAHIDGISKKILEKNSSNLKVGKCTIVKDDQGVTFTAGSLKDVLLNPVNLVFTSLILILAFIDQRYKKDLKGQIVSIGVLGTFVGIFIGLQGFDPSDIINSINKILVGLKTAFFTSIVGMATATFLSLYQSLRGTSEK